MGYSPSAVVDMDTTVAASTVLVHRMVVAVGRIVGRGVDNIVGTCCTHTPRRRHRCASLTFSIS